MRSTLLTNFHIYNDSNVNYKHSVEDISRTCSSCITELLYPLNSNSPYGMLVEDHLTVNASILLSQDCFGDFPGGPVVKNLPTNAGDTGSIPGWGDRKSVV